ncbi:hypothetical protein EON82_08460 [bacterium]|nr:MAG: hypothetical protein EON82_08460 [bacterium]
MLKQMTLAAFAMCSVAAFAGDDWNSIDPDTATSSELKTFVVKHAYKTMSAGDAYTLAQFLNRAPFNISTSLMKGLARNAVQAKMIRDENQTWANAQPPMGDTWTDWRRSYNADSMAMDESRAMRMYVANPKHDLDYIQTLDILASGLTRIEQTWLASTFAPRSFTESQIPTVMNERAMDAITKFVQGNASWAEPYRLKYTSLAPRPAYVSPIPSGWSSR